ncbi:hypothetical protein RZS19_18650, partial [Acinetobacter baumannii]|nr:hypothetical protein [Acinetobacter baumannii]
AILLKGVFYSAPNALWPSLYAEMFSLKNRYTGVGLATQISFIFAGFAPSICYLTLYTTNFTEPLSYQGSAFLKLPKFP